MKRKNLIKLAGVNFEVTGDILQEYYSSKRGHHFEKLSDRILTSEKLDKKNILSLELALPHSIIAQPYLGSFAGNSNLLERTKIIDYFGEKEENYFHSIYQIIFIINEHWNKTLEKYLSSANRSLVYFPYKNSLHENAIASIGAWKGNPDFYESALINEVKNKSFSDLHLNSDKCLIFYPE